MKSKAWRAAQRRKRSEKFLAKLATYGKLQHFTPYQIRVADLVDIYPTNQKYHVLKTNQRGIYGDIWKLLDEILPRPYPQATLLPEEPLVMPVIDLLDDVTKARHTASVAAYRARCSAYKAAYWEYCRTGVDNSMSSRRLQP